MYPPEVGLLLVGLVVSLLGLVPFLVGFVVCLLGLTPFLVGFVVCLLGLAPFLITVGADFNGRRVIGLLGLFGFLFGLLLGVLGGFVLIGFEL